MGGTETRKLRSSSLAASVLGDAKRNADNHTMILRQGGFWQPLPILAVRLSRNDPAQSVKTLLFW